MKKVWKPVNIPHTDARGESQVIFASSSSLDAALRWRLGYSLRRFDVLFFVIRKRFPVKGAASMEWTTPQHEEIDLNCEVSSYANAEL